MLDTSKPCQTRDGRKAIIIATNGTMNHAGYRYPIRARVEHPNDPGEWADWSYMANGQWKSNDTRNPNDLINGPDTTTAAPSGQHSGGDALNER